MPPSVASWRTAAYDTSEQPCPPASGAAHARSSARSALGRSRGKGSRKGTRRCSWPSATDSISEPRSADEASRSTKTTRLVRYDLTSGCRARQWGSASTRTALPAFFPSRVALLLPLRPAGAAPPSRCALSTASIWPIEKRITALKACDEANTMSELPSLSSSPKRTAARKAATSCLSEARCVFPPDTASTHPSTRGTVSSTAAVRGCGLRGCAAASAPSPSSSSSSSSSPPSPSSSSSTSSGSKGSAYRSTAANPEKLASWAPETWCEEKMCNAAPEARADSTSDTDCRRRRRERARKRLSESRSLCTAPCSVAARTWR
mmetsp:Transcript_14027/g.45052  ORF Transcript_14027/g.45052 Transcript_14027/m.45052 type:complete len:320 (-) Transcript_14027:406-1365(-)